MKLKLLLTFKDCIEIWHEAMAQMTDFEEMSEA
jgi:hypothetical protein